MEIVINVDIETLVRDEIRSILHERLVINNVPGATSVSDSIEVTGTVTDKVTITTQKAPTVPAPEDGWEFAPKVGKRRSKTQQAMHKQELALGRRLTPVEKGESAAVVEIDNSKEAKAKADAINKARIDEIADKAEAEAKAYLDQGSTEEVAPFTSDEVAADVETVVENDMEPATEENPEIPKADELPTLNSLFT